MSIYENVSINAASPINAIDPGGFSVTYSIPAYSVNSDKFCMKDNASGLIYVCHGVILDREVGCHGAILDREAGLCHKLLGRTWAGFVNTGTCIDETIDSS